MVVLSLGPVRNRIVAPQPELRPGRKAIYLASRAVLGDDIDV